MRRLACWCLLTVLAGCGPDDVAPVPAASLETDPSELRELKSMPSVLATVPGPGDRPFDVVARQGEISRYPCRVCHDRPLPARSDTPVSSWSNHVEIVLDHADTTILSCGTCHDFDELNSLRLNDGSRVDFDHAYRVCSQCHFEEARDWAGGAHGKREAGWRGRRVVRNCTGCHDPHSPGFQKVWPAPAPRIPRTGQAPAPSKDRRART